MSILDTLKDLNDTRYDEIEAWLAKQRAAAPPYFYNSVDLRHSGIKLAPVDTNLYPAGFNNLSPAALARASRLVRGYFTERHPKASRLLLVAESHTRNVNYLDNLAMRKAILERAGFETRIGSFAAQQGAPVDLPSPLGALIHEEPMVRQGDLVALEDGFVPDAIVLNNDLTSGIPPVLERVAQPVMPPADMGWWRRRKSIHFTAYTALAADFAQSFGLDPWLLTTEFHHCGMVDFKERVGQECLAEGVAKVLERVRKKYAQYGIAQEPYVFVKADSGTYGMGVMTARTPDDMLDLNKKTRNKMQVIKEGARVSEVIIQEGVPTVDKAMDRPAEPLVYLIDGVPAGGMYRVNAERDEYGNLNARGMEFVGMCDESETITHGGHAVPVDDCHFRSFGLIAAIAALATAREHLVVAPACKTA